MLKISKGLAVLSALIITGIVIAGINSGSLLDKQAPDITFPLLDGRELSLSSLAGKPVLITFWASTCIECRKEMPYLITLYNELSASGFEIIAVAMPYDPPNRVLEASQNHKVPYAVALDIDGKAVQAFGNVAVTPSAFLIAPDGNIVSSYTGRIDIEQLRDHILVLLADRQLASLVQACQLESPVTTRSSGHAQEQQLCPG